MKKTTKLQQLFAQDDIFVIAGGGCAIHARIAEDAGFECAYMSGATTAAMVHGIPDAGIMTLTEMVANAERMANCVEIPLISDADQGFGNAINVRRTVQAFVRAGVAGIHIEDQPFPKRCGFVKGKQTISLEEAVGKYRAAVEAKNELDADFVVIARCDARGTQGGSVAEVIERLLAYKAAGVDVLYAEALTSLDEWREVRQAVPGPLMGTLQFIKPHPTLEEQRKMGLSAAFYPVLIGIPSIEAAYEYAHDFRGRGMDAHRDWKKSRSKEHPFPKFGLFDLVGFPEIAKLEERYLPKEWLDKYEGSIGAYEPRIDKRTES